METFESQKCFTSYESPCMDVCSTFVENGCCDSQVTGLEGWYDEFEF